MIPDYLLVSNPLLAIESLVEEKIPTLSSTFTSNAAGDVMVISDLCDGEGVDRRREGGDVRVVYAINQPYLESRI